jgi:hypothetical protein
MTTGAVAICGYLYIVYGGVSWIIHAIIIGIFVFFLFGMFSVLNYERNRHLRKLKEQMKKDQQKTQ